MFDVLFKNYLISVLVVLSGILSAQNQLAIDRSINRVLDECSIDLSKDITVGSRIYIQSPRASVNVPLYVKDRIASEITGALQESKFKVVYQPFLEDHTIKKVHVSDSALRVTHSSSIETQFKNMRNVLDSLQGYNIDLLLASRIQMSELGDLILNVYIVNAKNLEVESSYVYYSNNKTSKGIRKSKLEVSTFFGQYTSAVAYREYYSIGQTIGPFAVKPQVNAVDIGFSQQILANDPSFNVSVFSGIESTHINEGINDSIYQLNSSSINAVRAGLSISGHLFLEGSKRPVAGITQKVVFAKPTLIDQYLVSESSLNICLSRNISAFAAIRYSQPIISRIPYKDIIEFQSYSICYGISLSL